MLINNLNNEPIPSDGEDVIQKHYGVLSGHVECYFKDIKDFLIAKIDRADIILGCVAWLTDLEILAALSVKKAVSIIINKEDFLRPDNLSLDFKEKLLRAYGLMPTSNTLNRYASFLIANKRIYPIVTTMSYCSSPDISPIRVMGVCNKPKSRNLPRNHHKFLVFCKEGRRGVNPYGVWTGSYNFTVNSERSFENAVYITDKKVVAAYLMEWGQVAALSEPLDWSSEYVDPEWRIGS